VLINKDNISHLPMEKKDFFYSRLDLPPLNMAWGIDGCKGGWLAIGLEGAKWVYCLEDSFEKLALQLFSKPSLCFVDMPMGLPEERMAERNCDKAARRFLSKRKASIFNSPTRLLLDAETYAQALTRSREIYGKGLSVQSWHLYPKVRELDQFVRKQKKPWLLESHPELCFQFHKNNAVEFSKHQKEGLAERNQIVSDLDPCASAYFQFLCEEIPKSKAKPDDILDALVLVLSAKKALDRKYVLGLLPAEFDGYNLPMNYHL
jgi:predicted RNase H-like nuclease